MRAALPHTPRPPPPGGQQAEPLADACFPTRPTIPTGTASGPRAWLEQLPAIPVPMADDDAEERAAIQAEARGEFGEARPEAEHQQAVAALLAGFRAHHRRAVQAAEKEPKP